MPAEHSNLSAYESSRSPVSDFAIFPAAASAPKAAGRGRLSPTVARIATIEFFAVACTAYLASAIYYRIIFAQWPPADHYIPAALFVAILILVVSLAFRQFAAISTQPLHRFLWSGLGAVALAFSFFLSAIFLLKVATDYSRGTFFFQFIGTAIAMLTVRAKAYSRLHSAITSGSLEARRAIVIGDFTDAEQLSDRLKNSGVYTVASFRFPIHDDEHGETAANGAGRKNGNVRKLIEACRTLRPDDILILATANDLPTVPYLADTLSELPVSLHVVPTGALGLLASSRLAELGSVVTIQLFHPPLSMFDQVLKRASDLAIATLGLVVLSPLFVLVSIAIKLDSRGPVFFRQKRHGYNNEPIWMFKFRSMTTVEDGSNFMQAVRNDARVTRVGRILRSTNIDELLQLLNVLIGDMSIVGPRPHPVALNELFEAQISPFSRRHNVKPGITGWAQVNGYRGETDTLEKMQRRLEYDLYYIDNWSFLLDMKIILMTLFSKKAYLSAY